MPIFTSAAVEITNVDVGSLFVYTFFGVFLFTIAFSIFSIFSMLEGPHLFRRAKQVIQRRKPMKPVIGYKMAHFIGSEGIKPFTGITGTPYGVVDASTDYSISVVDGGRGFHMYDTFEKAKDHPQVGNVLLEVIGYGDVQKYDLGYVTSEQRVLQIIVGKCAEVSCSYPAGMWDDKDKWWLCNLHGKMNTLVSRSGMSFEELEACLEKGHGHRVAVRSYIAPRKRGLMKRWAQRDDLPKFIPITELVPQASIEHDPEELVNN